MAKGKLEKEMKKALKRQRWIFGILFMKIMEIRRKGRWNVTGFTWGINWRKIKKNEEIRGMNNKKTSEHQLVAFFQFILRINLREEKRTKRRRRSSKQMKDKESKGNKRSSKERLDQATSTWILVGNMLHVWFPICFWHSWYMHVCICCHWHWFYRVW